MEHADDMIAANGGRHTPVPLSAVCGALQAMGVHKDDSKETFSAWAEIGGIEVDLQKNTVKLCWTLPESQNHREYTDSKQAKGLPDARGEPEKMHSKSSSHADNLRPSKSPALEVTDADSRNILFSKGTLRPKNLPDKVKTTA